MQENEFEEFEEEEEEEEEDFPLFFCRVFLFFCSKLLIRREKKTRKAETTHLRNIILVVIVFTHTRTCFII